MPSDSIYRWSFHVDRDPLRRIIAEELARALADEGRTGEDSASSPASSRLALVCFSGNDAPCRSLAPLFRAAQREGWTLDAVTSFSFRSVVLKAHPGALGDLSAMSDPDDEAALSRRLARTRAVVFPDISANSLNKAALGIADSLPTRAIAQALTAQACLLLETASPPSPVVGLSRLETLRRLERRGALLADGESFIEQLRRTGASPVPAVFKPLSGAPAQGRSPAGRAVVTVDDIVAAAQQGLPRLRLPPGAIVTDRAREEALRRGMILVADEADS
jgi:hypothetical protein